MIAGRAPGLGRLVQRCAAVERGVLVEGSEESALGLAEPAQQEQNFALRILGVRAFRVELAVGVDGSECRWQVAGEGEAKRGFIVEYDPVRIGSLGSLVGLGGGGKLTDLHEQGRGGVGGFAVGGRSLGETGHCGGACSQIGRQSG